MDGIMKTKLSVALLALALPVVIASAQSQGVTPEATDRFEVATVRQNANSVRSGPGFSGQPGRFSAQDVTLQDLITFAYELQAFEIFGAPNWATSDRFDIGATMQPPPTGPRRDLATADCCVRSLPSASRSSRTRNAARWRSTPW